MFGLKIDKQNHFEFCEVEFKPLATKNVEDDLLKLQGIYQQVPLTNCQQCGKCCGRAVGNPVMFSLEYINAYRYIREHLGKDIQREIFASAGLSQALLWSTGSPEPRPGCFCEYAGRGIYLCPCLDIQRNVCRIYPARPLVCRVYGAESWQKTPDTDWQMIREPRCPNVKIAAESRIQTWNPNIIADLFRELRKVSAYYLWDEAANTLLNEEQLLYWFASKLKGGRKP